MTQVLYVDDHTLIDADTPPSSAGEVAGTEDSSITADTPTNPDESPAPDLDRLAARYAETLALLEAAEETIRTLHRHLETLTRPAPTCIYVTVAAGGTLYLNGGMP